MNRPPFEVADIIRQHGKSFIENNRSWLTYLHLRVLHAIEHCRTAALGGHLDGCSRCGHQAISYNSCRNRHCPKCQTQARQRWLAAREQEVLPTAYFHVVFSVPHELNVLALENPHCFYDRLFAAASATLLEVAANPKRFGAEIGIIAILHIFHALRLAPAAEAVHLFHRSRASGASLIVRPSPRPLKAPLTAQLRLSKAEPDATCEHQRNRAGEAVLVRGTNLRAGEHLLRNSSADTMDRFQTQVSLGGRKGE
jgi:hypothetical protein